MDLTFLENLTLDAKENGQCNASSLQLPPHSEKISRSGRTSSGAPPPPPLPPPTPPLSNTFEHLCAGSAELKRCLQIDYASTLGEGAFGSVYVAQQVDNPSAPQLAVKVVRITRLSAQAKRQLEQEVVLQSHVHHPHIVGLVACYKASGNALHLVMHAHAGDLGALVCAGQLSLTRLLAPRLMGELFEALRHLHDDHHIVHSDLKPSNLLLCDAGSLMLCDLGAAARIDSGRSTVVGAPAYLAPEVVAISHLGLLGAQYSFPSDLWSCGIILVELLTGALPFPACARDPTVQPAAICFARPDLGDTKMGAAGGSVAGDVALSVAPEARSLVLSLLCKQAYLRPTAAEALASPFVHATPAASAAAAATDCAILEPQSPLSADPSQTASHGREACAQEARAVAPATPALREALGLLRRARMAAAQAPSTPTPNTPLPNTPRDSLCGSGSSMGSSRGCQSSSSAVSWASSLVEEA